MKRRRKKRERPKQRKVVALERVAVALEALVPALSAVATAEQQQRAAVRKLGEMAATVAQEIAAASAVEMTELSELRRVLGELLDAHWLRSVG